MSIANFLIVFLISTFAAIGSTYAAGKSAMSDSDLHCFSDQKYGRAPVEQFISAQRYAQQRSAAEGLMELSSEDIRRLRDPEDSAICIRFNEMFADILAARMIDDERYAEIAHLLDPFTPEWAVSYYKAGEFYFVLIGKAEAKAKDSDSLLLVRTGDSLSILVHDLELNLVATRACPGETCPPHEFEKHQWRR